MGSKYEFVIAAKDATGRAFASVNSQLSGVSKHAAKTATAIAGVTATFAALTVRAVGTAKDLKAQANLAGETVENFQALAFAFDQYNISAEKFADISKDVQDKLGDFLATGAGPFKDFFEQVAPKVGLTADALKELSSTEVLIAVKNAMDAANVSAKEQVFYMEAIANDATLLLPALRNSGQAISDLADEYRSLNLVTSETDVETTARLAKEIKKLDAATDKLTISLSATFIPILADTVTAINDLRMSAILYVERDLIEMSKWVTEASLGWLKFRDAIGSDVDLSEIERLTFEAEYLQKKYDQLTDEINGKVVKPKVEPVADMVGARDKKPNTFTLPELDLTKIEAQGKNARNTLLDSLSLLDEINSDPFGLNELLSDTSITDGLDTTVMFSIKPTKDSEALKKYNDSLVDSALSTMDAIHAERLRYDGMEAELEAIRYERQLDQMEKEMSLLEERGLLSQEIKDRYRQAELEAQENHQAALQEIEDSRMNVMTEGFQSLLGIMGSYYDGIEGKQAGYARAAIELTSIMLDAEKRKSLTSIWMNTYDTAMKAYNAMASIPYVGPFLGAAAATTVIGAGTLYAAQVTGLASFDGGGYTWDGARTGGLDGKGGRLAVLHPQETVFDHTKGQGLTASSGDTYQINIQAIDADGVKNLFMQNGKSIGRAIARDARRRGRA